MIRKFRYTDDYTGLAISLINELGYLALSKELRISTPAIANWKKKGVPFNRIQYLKMKYPALKTWDKFNINGV